MTNEISERVSHILDDTNCATVEIGIRKEVFIRNG